MADIVTRPSGANDTPLPLAGDLMRGADEVARFMFGAPQSDRQAESDRRAVYHLATKGELGLFKMGGTLCGRKSTILEWIASREGRAA